VLVPVNVITLAVNAISARIAPCITVTGDRIVSGSGREASRATGTRELTGSRASCLLSTAHAARTAATDVAAISAANISTTADSGTATSHRGASHMSPCAAFVTIEGRSTGHPHERGDGRSDRSDHQTSYHQRKIGTFHLDF